MEQIAPRELVEFKFNSPDPDQAAYAIYQSQSTNFGELKYARHFSHFDYETFGRQPRTRLNDYSTTPRQEITMTISTPPENKKARTPRLAKLMIWYSAKPKTRKKRLKKLNEKFLKRLKRTNDLEKTRIWALFYGSKKLIHKFKFLGFATKWLLIFTSKWLFGINII